MIDWEESSTSNKLGGYQELDTREELERLPKLARHYICKFTKSHSSPAALRNGKYENGILKTHLGYFRNFLRFLQFGLQITLN